MIRKTYRQKMKAYYIAGVTLLILIACGNRYDKREETDPQDSIGTNSCAEITDSAASATYKDGHAAYQRMDVFLLSQESFLTAELLLITGENGSLLTMPAKSIS